MESKVGIRTKETTANGKISHQASPNCICDFTLRSYGLLRAINSLNGYGSAFRETAQGSRKESQGRSQSKRACGERSRKATREGREATTRGSPSLGAYAYNCGETGSSGTGSNHAT